MQVWHHAAIAVITVGRDTHGRSLYYAETATKVVSGMALGLTHCSA